MNQDSTLAPRADGPGQAENLLLMGDSPRKWLRWLYGQRSSLPQDITSRDLFKAVALTLMVADHIGLYFADLDLLRAVGRCSMPIWLFLVGYSHSRRLPPILWLGAAVVLAVDSGLGYAVWPMRILFTVIVVRLVLSALGDYLFRSPIHLGAAVTLLFITLPPSREILQYGNHAMLFAMLGYGLLNAKRLNIANLSLLALALVSCTGYFIFQSKRFAFEDLTMAVFAGLLLATGIAMFRFRPRQFSGTRGVYGASLLRLMGRWTLEIYVIHLVAFKIVYWAWFHGYLSKPFV